MNLVRPLPMMREVVALRGNVSTAEKTINMDFLSLI